MPIASTFCNEWVSRYEVPLRITTDQRPQFTHSYLKNYVSYSLLGTQCIKTASYNPKANGMVERFHRRLKKALKIRGSTWTKYLLMILLGL